MNFTQVREQSDVTIRTFNHDLLLDEQSIARAERRWPHVAFALVDRDLVAEFAPHESRAKRLKRRVQWVGSIAVLLMTGTLLYSATQLVPGHTVVDGQMWRLLSESCALIGIGCAILASHYGPWRREWLRSRYMTEVLRQWHFRRLLVGSALDLLPVPHQHPGVYLSDRKASFDALLQRIYGSVGQKMDRLTDTGVDFLGTIPNPHLPKHPDMRDELLDAYRVLRLDHQLDYATWKLSKDDKTFGGLSSSLLVRLTDRLAGATLIVAMLFSSVQLFTKIEWTSFVAVSLAILGVGVRAWRDGLTLQDDRERYEEVSHRLELLTVRWEAAGSDERRFHLAEEVEQLALEELRGFLRSHERSQFLF